MSEDFIKPGNYTLEEKLRLVPIGGEPLTQQRLIDMMMDVCGVKEYKYRQQKLNSRQRRRNRR